MLLKLARSCPKKNSGLDCIIPRAGMNWLRSVSLFDKFNPCSLKGSISISISICYVRNGQTGKRFHFSVFS